MDSPAIGRLRIEWQTLGTAQPASSAGHRFPGHEPALERLAQAPESTTRKQRVFPSVSNDDDPLQMDRQGSLSVDGVAAVLRLRRTRTCHLEMTKRIQSEGRTASARGNAGALIPDQGGLGRDAVEEKIPSHSGKIS